jgi:putative transposase
MQKVQRNSFHTTNKIYFFTATIHKWYPLLLQEGNQELIVRYLKKLCEDGLLTVYGFVLMPNHIHLIWQQNKLNGKETPQGSLLKYTAHEFLKKLKAFGQSKMYELNAANKKHEIWQRDSLSIELYSKKVALQKLDYIYFIPVKGKWQLSKDDVSYHYSSARFYSPGFVAHETSPPLVAAPICAAACVFNQRRTMSAPVGRRSNLRRRLCFQPAAYKN